MEHGGFNLRPDALCGQHDTAPVTRFLTVMEALTFTGTHHHKAAHEVVVRHAVDFTPSTLSVIREVRNIVIAVGITVASVALIRSVTGWSNRRAR